MAFILDAICHPRERELAFEGNTAHPNMGMILLELKMLP
jgi:hypothetical protein